MATRIRLNALETRILNHMLLSDGFIPVEELLADIRAERNAFVDALEILEAEGLLCIANLGTIVVGLNDGTTASEASVVSRRIGDC